MIGGVGDCCGCECGFESIGGLGVGICGGLVDFENVIGGFGWDG